MNESKDRAALRATVRLLDEALPKFNWAASALDANAVRLLNDVPNEVRAALAEPDPAQELLANLRADVDSLPLHAHKRKDVSDWLDSHGAGGESQQKLKADAYEMIAEILQTPNGLSVVDQVQATKERADAMAVQLRYVTDEMEALLNRYVTNGNAHSVARAQIGRARALLKS